VHIDIGVAAYLEMIVSPTLRGTLLEKAPWSTTRMDVKPYRLKIRASDVLIAVLEGLDEERRAHPHVHAREIEYAIMGLRQALVALDIIEERGDIA
jgi:hypothetical protein